MVLAARHGPVRRRCCLRHGRTVWRPATSDIEVEDIVGECVSSAVGTGVREGLFVVLGAFPLVTKDGISLLEL